MRYAGDLFAAFGEQLREQQLAANRSQPIGAGGNAVVYASDVPGNVMKQSTNRLNSMEDEANFQAIAADMGLAPRIAGVETFRGHIGDRIEMQDISENFEPRSGRNGFPAGMDAVRVNQQLGQLALKGIDLEDRHVGNVRYNKMTGRPLQLDFGIASKVSGENQVDALARATEAGLNAAGLTEEASIYTATVYDLLAGGQVKEAMDVAKQGFAQLQKIRSPISDKRIPSARTILAEQALAEFD